MAKNKKEKTLDPIKQSWLGNLCISNRIQKSEVSDSHINKVKYYIKSKNPPKIHKHHLRNLSSGVFACLFVAFLFMLSSYNYAKFSVGNLKLPAKLSDQQLSDRLNTQLKHYILNIQLPDKTIKSYHLNDIGYSLNDPATISNLRQNQHNLTNELLFYRPIKSQLIFNKNISQLNSFINKATDITLSAPVDAKISLSGGNISVIDGMSGKQYGLINPIKVINYSVNNLNQSPIKLTSVTVNPTITSDKLMPYKQELEKTLKQPITFMINDQTIRPSSSDIANWLDISPNDTTKKVDISVNSGKLLAYLQAKSAYYVHPAKAQVNVVDSNGNTQILVAGINGQTISNVNDVSIKVSNNLLNGQGINESLPVVYKPYETITAGNYPKWIEVDLTNKRLYAYEQTNLVNSYLVSAGAPKTPTVTGQYAIYSKLVTQNMYGQNVDGSNYYQPNVPWVNYFYGSYAIHGNYWRPTSYFGNINSSHGCVGLMVSDAEWVYNWAPDGTPVIVHY